MTLIISDRCLSLKLLIFKLICQCVTPTRDRLPWQNCPKMQTKTTLDILVTKCVNIPA